MADERSPFQFEDVPLDQARLMGRGPRMEPLLYETLRNKIQSLSGDAVRVRLGPEITPNRMKNYIMRLARDLGVPVTVRRMPGGLVFWRSTVEDMELAQEIGERLQSPSDDPKPAPEGAGRGNPARGQRSGLTTEAIMMVEHATREDACNG